MLSICDDGYESCLCHVRFQNQGFYQFTLLFTLLGLRLCYGGISRLGISFGLVGVRLPRSYGGFPTEMKCARFIFIISIDVWLANLIALTLRAAWGILLL